MQLIVLQQLIIHVDLKTNYIVYISFDSKHTVSPYVAPTLYIKKCLFFDTTSKHVIVFNH